LRGNGGQAARGDGAHWNRNGKFFDHARRGWALEGHDPIARCSCDQKPNGAASRQAAEGYAEGTFRLGEKARGRRRL